MDTNWTRAQLSGNNKLGGLSADLLRSGNELLARELALSLSAFLRCTVAVAPAAGEEVVFAERAKDNKPVCSGAALLRPGDQPLLIELERSALFPLVGIALGAKLASFAVPDRKPTDIEIQVVNLLFRLILSETYRAWEPLVHGPLETVSLDIEQPSARPFQATDSVFVTSFEIKIGDHSGHLTFITRRGLFSKAFAADEPVFEREKPSETSLESTLELLLPAKIAVNVWLEGSQMSLEDLMQLHEGQVITLDHPVERKANLTLNGKSGFTGQIVSTGAHRAFLVEE